MRFLLDNNLSPRVATLRSPLAGHASSRTSEIAYRHQLRPIMEDGALALDHLFSRTA